MTKTQIMVMAAALVANAAYAEITISSQHQEIGSEIFSHVTTSAHNTKIDIDIQPEPQQQAMAQETFENIKQAQTQDINKIANEIFELSKTRNGAQFFSQQTKDAFNQSETTGSNPELAHDQLVLFVSSSMPLKTLRAYARDLSKVNGVMAMRGMVGGIRNYQEHMRFLWDVLRVDPYCKISTCETFATDVLVDPVLFQEYGINKVPALIFQPDMQIASYCDDLSTMKKAKKIAYGDIYLGGLIEQISDERNDLSRFTQMLKGKGGHNE